MYTKRRTLKRIDILQRQLTFELKYIYLKINCTFYDTIKIVIVNNKIFAIPLIFFEIVGKSVFEINVNR